MILATDIYHDIRLSYKARFHRQVMQQVKCVALVQIHSKICVGDSFALTYKRVLTELFKVSQKSLLKGWMHNKCNIFRNKHAKGIISYYFYCLDSKVGCNPWHVEGWNWKEVGLQYLVSRYLVIRFTNWITEQCNREALRNKLDNTLLIMCDCSKQAWMVSKEEVISMGSCGFQIAESIAYR